MPSDRRPVRHVWRPHRPPLRAEDEARPWLAAELGLPPPALALDRDARNRPRLHGACAGWDCNWSHSGEHLLIALGQGVDVGIDVERLRPRPRALELARRFFDPREAEALGRHPAGVARDLAFARLWCLKEAVLKAHGHGLSFGLHRAVFDADTLAATPLWLDPALGPAEAWQVRTLAAPDGYVAALAWRAPSGASPPIPG